METLGPVIVAVGGRDPSAALHAARVFARLSPAGVLALSVLEPLPIHAFGEEPRLPPPSFDAEREAALEARLEALVREASGEPGAWRMEVQLGDPAHVIADVAARERSPLIIMGIGRHSVVDRLLQRETVIRTIRLARSPVLAVSGAIASPPQRVVVGTDFSAESALAAQAALSLMGDEGS
ncbi:MAG: universal stress protein, partial [Gemmatimonadaceae bacterium]